MTFYRKENEMMKNKRKRKKIQMRDWKKPDLLVPSSHISNLPTIERDSDHFIHCPCGRATQALNDTVVCTRCNEEYRILQEDEPSTVPLDPDPLSTGLERSWDGFIKSPCCKEQIFSVGKSEITCSCGKKYKVYGNTIGTLK